MVTVPTRETAVEAVKTYRYVRLAMVAMVVGLAAAVAVEGAKVAESCFQHSISAYYYTPVRGFFVGSLLAVGVCLVALRGNDDWEDALLNLAGMFAPVVALVPTPNEGSCSSSPGTGGDRAANVSNNVSALLIVGAVGLVLAVAIAGRRRGAAFDASNSSRAGYAVAAGVYLLALATFFWTRTSFLEKAHYTAAILMFLCIFGVVVINSRDLNARQVQESGPAQNPRSYANRYALIAWAMAISTVGITAYNQAVGWDHAVLWLEGVLIVLFGIFWVIQTHELWNQGIRQET